MQSDVDDEAPAGAAASPDFMTSTQLGAEAVVYSCCLHSLSAYVSIAEVPSAVSQVVIAPVLPRA